MPSKSKTLFAWLLTGCLLATLQASAQALRSVQYTNTSRLLYPAGILWSNIIAGTNVSFDLSDGKLRVSSSGGTGEVSSIQLNNTSNYLYSQIMSIGGDTNGYTSNQVFLLSSSMDLTTSNGLTSFTLEASNAVRLASGLASTNLMLNTTNAIWSAIAGAGGLNTNADVAFKTNVSVGGTLTANIGNFASLQVASLEYSISEQRPITNAVVSFTNAPLAVVNVTNTSVLVLVTNFSQGASMTLLLNGGGTARNVYYAWPENIDVRWRNGTNSTVTNQTLVSFLCETNTTGTNRILARHDTQ